MVLIHEVLKVGACILLHPGPLDGFVIVAPLALVCLVPGDYTA